MSGLFVVGLLLANFIYGAPVPPSAQEIEQFDISLVSYEEIKGLYSDYLTTTTSHSFPDGCHAKAQKIALFLDEYGVRSGKVFVEGGLFYQSKRFGLKYWTFHVATFVIVESSQGTFTYVLDPLLFMEPVPLARWYEVVGHDPRTKIREIYYRNRFIYSNLEKDWSLEDYAPFFIEDMHTTIEQIEKRLAAFTVD